MSETRAIHDPFLNKTVEISDRLTDRLRGRYAVGPTLPNGEPEFGWREHKTPPIQHEAAAEIERLRNLLEAIAPFAAIGGLLNMAGKAAMPDDVSASRLKLDGLKAEHFRAAHVAMTACAPKTAA